MRLALRMGRTLQELLASLSSDEITLWQAFDAIEPLGDWRMDLGFGMVAATLANVNRGKNTPAFAPADFMPLRQRLREAAPASLAQQIRTALKPLMTRGKDGLSG